ncbi:PREDICTED: cytochrome C oxidase subunit [Prunus dulcis]|uniref:PREDICTED: cytochrome C oxidase subunit n=1 Tax=Prunus dulcis TaxID=3755 RepID=A0A5E4FI91_PRUDU|nr:PREDICTED: cytochrome C oxidase subunit [Prunus dulcis]
MVDATFGLQTWGIGERPTALARPKILDLIIQPRSHLLIAKLGDYCLEERSTGGNLGNEIVDKKGKLSVSSIDFVGLGSAVKKEDRGLPAGNFDAVAWKPEQTQGDNSDLYKPKVSSWGVFPRPNDISKTFGGGRVIRPREVLETAEEKAAKEARTRRLVAAYKSKMGVNSDPQLRSECDKVLRCFTE